MSELISQAKLHHKEKKKQSLRATLAKDLNSVSSLLVPGNTLLPLLSCQEAFEPFWLSARGKKVTMSLI